MYRVWMQDGVAPAPFYDDAARALGGGGGLAEPAHRGTVRCRSIGGRLVAEGANVEEARARRSPRR